MIERIRETLSELGIDIWRINWDRTESAELFFIRRKADMRRQKDVTGAGVTVYRDFTENGERMRGSSYVNVYPGMRDADLVKSLREAYAAAAYVKNPWYDLPDAVTADVRSADSAFAGDTLAGTARRMAYAMFSADTRADAFLNSAELFVTRTESLVLASNGLEVRYAQSAVKGEFVAQCEEPQDVELYRDFHYTKPDENALAAEVADALDTVRDRARASEAPIGGVYDCILSGRQLATLLSAYVEKSDAPMVYAKYSKFSEGCSVQGDDVSGEKLNIDLTSDAPFSDEGVPMPGLDMVREGKLLSLHGSNRFCRYLGIEPKGEYESFAVHNGSMAFAEMRKAPCIWPVAFSDFQTDALAGRFGGEIRLAYVYDGDNVRLVTGGSINGSMLEAQKDMVFSLERYSSKDYTGPFAVRLKGVSVAGRQEG